MMKVLILCNNAQAIINNGNINNLGTIYGYYFHKWLSKYDDCSIDLYDLRLPTQTIEKLDTYDFCIITVNRGVKILSNEVYQALRQKTKYQIITLCPSNSIVDKEDVLLFTMGKIKPNTMRLFWGADFDLLKPQKNQQINILVDHKYYGNVQTRKNMIQKDKTELLINSLLKYKNDGHDIIIKHIGLGKVHEVTNDYQIEAYRQGACMDFREIYQYYNEAHIYVVTHLESFGLTTIECACAGALIVQPNGYIKKDIIKKLHHVSLLNLEQIDWDQIIQQVDIAKSMKMASIFSYENAFKKLHHHLLATVKSVAKK